MFQNTDTGGILSFSKRRRILAAPVNRAILGVD